MNASWTSPKTIKGIPSEIHGLGFFALEPIARGELVAVKWGRVVDKATLDAHRDIVRGCELPIASGLYLAPLTTDEFRRSMVYVNHSCDPNLGACGERSLVAMRDINAGEELTADMGSIFDNPTFVFVGDCQCGATNCRGRVTGNDWRLPELQRRYGALFPRYILAQINRQHSTQHAA